MSTVKTLTAMRPPARADGLPWTHARMEEASAATGTWTAIETFELELDEDPSAPSPREFTSEEATLTEGWYRIVWLDEDGDQALEQPEFLGPPYQPTLAEVARAMRSRIRDDLGNTLASFTADTTPNATDVAGYILDAADFLTSRVGPDVPNRDRRLARRVCALRAALDAERAIARGKETQRAKELATTFQEELAALLGAPGDEPTRPNRFGSLRTPTIYTAGA